MNNFVRFLFMVQNIEPKKQLNIDKHLCVECSLQLLLKYQFEGIIIFNLHSY